MHISGHASPHPPSERTAGICSIWVASDHAGFTLKKQVLARLSRPERAQERAERSLPREQLHDLGPASEARVDYPDLAWPLTEQVAAALDSGEAARGILICGTGIGVSLVANRHPQIRAALAHNLFTAEMARRHNDAQILCLGARVIGSDLALAMVELFLDTPFEGGRHATRLERLQALYPTSS